jgi:hypothetical protein
MRIEDDNDSGTMNLALIIAAIVALYSLICIAFYLWIRVQADANADGKITQEEYTSKKAQIFTGTPYASIFGYGVGLLESFVPQFFPYDVVAAS